jgi:hypothetical protein
MSYINKGDMLKVNGETAIATSADYTKLVFDDYDLEMSRRSRDYEGGTAMCVVDVLFTETGRKASAVRIGKVTKVASLAE